jgi:nucleotide-binding universal stress UspA family protein
LQTAVPQPARSVTTVACTIGVPVEEILRYARAHAIGLIVVGTHGRGVVAHAFLGSVAERVVRRAPCPVLTVHHLQHEFVREPLAVDEPAAVR